MDYFVIYVKLTLLYVSGQDQTGQQSMPGQPMTLQQSIRQPQFHVIQQPFSGQQYATFPQFAYANQQGQLVLQQAQFALSGGHGQPQGQQVILTGVPQKPGQQMLTGPGTQGKGGPQYTITSSGEIQMPGPGPQEQQTFMIANPMGQCLQGQVSMSGPNGHTHTINTSNGGNQQQGQVSMSGRDLEVLVETIPTPVQ